MRWRNVHALVNVAIYMTILTHKNILCKYCIWVLKKRVKEVECKIRYWISRFDERGDLFVIF